MKVFEYFVKYNLLENNVKFIFEGEEEIGLLSLEVFCEEYKELLKVDVILVLDISMLGVDFFLLIIGLCGLVYWEIEIIGFNCDFYLGYFGGVVVNLINVFCGMLSKVIDIDGCIIIFGFYDVVEEVL